MWPFKKKDENNSNSEKLANDAIQDLNCNLHQIDFISCLNEKKSNHKHCFEYLDKFRICLAEK